ncbi:MAG: trehalose-6-phosphate synthase [Candidatus Edwardsbacteria bacterium]
MKINLTIIISVLIAVGLVALSFTLFQVYQERQRLQMDLERRSVLLVESLQEGILAQIEKGKISRLQQTIEKLGRHQRLIGAAVYNATDSLLAGNLELKPYLDIAGSVASMAMDADSALGITSQKDLKKIYLYAGPLRQEGSVVGAIVLVHDTGYIDKILSNIWKTNFIRWFVQALVVALVTLAVIRWSIFNPLNKMVDWMKSVRIGYQDRHILKKPPGGLFAPLHKEVNQLTQAITEARAVAEEEARLRATAEAIWTPERLKEEVKNLLGRQSLIAVSNREPYMHICKGKSIECIVPASGLVTAMEPILKACGGTWIASGSGDADREAVNEYDKVMVPPEEPKYTLRRIWLSKEEEDGFYYGFANEGLWPLCHIAHTRPLFRKADWEYYQAVNKKYAQAVIEEIKNEDQPVVLVQDYHFALLSKLIKEQRPDARVGIFWHIPWPNPESFGICPWQKELLTGMLGADIVGFHTQYHCNNFLETIDRFLESQIIWENFSVKMSGHTTLVRPFPISIAFTLKDLENEDRYMFPPAELLKEYGLSAQYIGVGVDRIDYTKGIIERFLAVERFLEKYPSYQGKFTFVELGAPSRTLIKRYFDLVNEVESEANRINRHFKSKDWKPILMLKKHHSHAEIMPFYVAAQLCLVTSLHDGMNLVAKEFVASRHNNDGVLILSRFTGAAQELRDALIINPYDIEQSAEAIKYALEMPLEEQQPRMKQMRQFLVSHNIYLWAANIIRELASI